MTQETDRNGRVISFTYDRLNRLTLENYTTGGTSIAFAYSVNGMVTSATDSASATIQTFTYDNLNRLLSKDTKWPGVSGTLTQTWGYDKASNLTSYAFAKNGTAQFTNNYTYDSMSRLILLTQSGSVANDKSLVFTYNANSQYASITRYHDLTQSGGNQVAQTLLTYDYMNRLTKKQTYLGTSPSSIIYSQSYNITSQITALATIDGTSNFTYDNDGQLLTVSAGAMPAENFAFDASGNRDSAGYSTGSDNQMTAAPNLAATTSHYEFAYDHEGNTTDRWLKTGTASTEHIVYTWDFRNRLTEVQTYTVSGTVSTLTQTVDIGYDAFDNRAHEKVTDNAHSNTVTQDQRFVYDGFNPAAVVDATTLTATQVFLYGLGQNEVFAQDNVGTSSTMTLWAVTDHLGSVRDVINSSGSVINHVVLSSFGDIVSQSSPGNAMLPVSAGMLFDSVVDLYYDKRRWYDSGFGRFYSVDPIGFNSGQTDLYVYCADNPINSLDASGLETIGEDSHKIVVGTPVNSDDFNGGTIQVFVDGHWPEMEKPTNSDLQIVMVYKNKNNQCKKYHWVQFIRTLTYKHATYEPLPKRLPTKMQNVDKTPGVIYRKSGEWYLDADTLSSYYDDYGTAFKNEGLTYISDQPTVGYFRDDGVDVSVEAHSYLVDENDKGVWDISWERHVDGTYKILASAKYDHSVVKGVTSVGYRDAETTLEVIARNPLFDTSATTQP